MHATFLIIRIKIVNLQLIQKKKNLKYLIIMKRMCKYNNIFRN